MGVAAGGPGWVPGPAASPDKDGVGMACVERGRARCEGPLEVPRGPARGFPPPGHLLVLLALALGACGDDPAPSIEVGEYIRYPERDVLGLSETQRNALATLTGIGLAVARGEVAALGEPRIERLEREILVEALVDEVTLLRSGVGDDVLRARYDVSPSWQLQVRHMVFLADRTAPDTARARALEAARGGLARVEAGEDFAAVASELSEEPGAAQRGGLLRPAREGDWVPEFWRGAAALEPGESSGVVESVYGYHVIRLERKELIPFADVRDRVAREVAGMLGRPEREGARTALVQEISEGMTVAEGAVDRLRGRAPGVDPLVTWPGGSLRPEGFQRWLAGREGGEIMDPTGASEEDWGAALRAAAVEEALVSRALERGLRVPDQESQALRTSWQSQMAFWSQALGFREGMPPPEVAAAARAALGASGQDAAIAREEIQRVRALVRSAYPVQVAPPQ